VDLEEINVVFFGKPDALAFYLAFIYPPSCFDKGTFQNLFPFWTRMPVEARDDPIIFPNYKGSPPCDTMSSPLVIRVHRAIGSRPGGRQGPPRHDGWMPTGETVYTRNGISGIGKMSADVFPRALKELLLIVSLFDQLA